MDSKVAAVLNEYAKRMEAESRLMKELPRDEAVRRRDEWLLAVGPDTGALLNALAKATGARHVLEIGTSHGYSTLWLAEAMAHTGGKVTTIELHEGKAEFAKQHVAKAGLSAYVDVLVGDALAILRTLGAPIDFVLIDLWKDLYIPCFDLVYPKLAAGALVVADNMLQPEHVREQASAYREHVRSTAHMTSILLNVGSGLELSRLR